jgi:hypothetical protein
MFVEYVHPGACCLTSALPDGYHIVGVDKLIEDDFNGSTNFFAFTLRRERYTPGVATSRQLVTARQPIRFLRTLLKIKAAIRQSRPMPLFARRPTGDICMQIRFVFCQFLFVCS